jgi:hypothetical protein
MFGMYNSFVDPLKTFKGFMERRCHIDNFGPPPHIYNKLFEINKMNEAIFLKT